MRFNIYDHNDNITIVDTKDKDIDRIMVDVVSGDEIVDIEYIDGSFEKVDSSKNRFINYYDGSYTLLGDKLVEWMDFKAKEGVTCLSYERLEKFWSY